MADCAAALQPSFWHPCRSTAQWIPWNWLGRARDLPGIGGGGPPSRLVTMNRVSVPWSPGLEADDDALDPAPALRGIVARARSDRLYFISFPARDGRSAGIECAVVLGDGSRGDPGGIISGITVREVAKPGWTVMRARNPRPLGAIPGSGERSTVVGNVPAAKADDAERVTTVGDDVPALGTFTRGITAVEVVKPRTTGNRTCEARSPGRELGRRPRSCRQVSVPVPIPGPAPIPIPLWLSALNFPMSS
jgi:hypothetical protein